MNTDTAIASIGKLVHRTDGTPRPPERFNKKLAAWKANNYSGLLTEAEANKWGEGKTYVNVETKRYSYAIFNQSGWLNDNLHLGEHPEAPAHETVT